MQRTLFSAIGLFLVLSISVPEVKAETGFGEEVFIDEADGDFDPLSVLPSDLVSQELEAELSAAEVRETAEDPLAAPAPAVKPAPAKPAKKKAATAESEKIKPAADKKSRKPASVSQVGVGHFVRTKDACPMLRQPASDSEEMLTVKPAKKIWVEDVDANWVKAFNKEGEPGFIQKDCLE